MRIRDVVVSLLAVGGLVLLIGCSDDSEKPQDPTMGTLSALVIDEGLDQPVENVTVTVTPGDFVQETGSDGLAVFELPAGEYFVDASVCCAGPGNIEYHLSVTVDGGQTTRVKMTACLGCL